MGMSAKEFLGQGTRLSLLEVVQAQYIKKLDDATGEVHEAKRNYLAAAKVFIEFPNSQTLANLNIAERRLTDRLDNKSTKREIKESLHLSGSHVEDLIPRISAYKSQYNNLDNAAKAELDDVRNVSIRLIHKHDPKRLLNDIEAAKPVKPDSDLTLATKNYLICAEQYVKDPSDVRLAALNLFKNNFQNQIQQPKSTWNLLVKNPAHSSAMTSIIDRINEFCLDTSALRQANENGPFLDMISQEINKLSAENKNLKM